MPLNRCRSAIVTLTAALLACATVAWGRTLVVNQASPRAADTNAATDDAPLKTINAAAQLAQPGDTVLVHAGIYRECIVPPRGGQPGQPITYQAAPDEQVSVRGCDVFAPAWQSVPDHPGLYTAPIDADTFRTRLDSLPGRKVLGQVIVDGHMLNQADSADDVTRVPDTWITDGSTLTVHFPATVTDPVKHLVEITVRRNGFRPDQRGLGYITIRGFHFAYAANQSLGGFWNNDAHVQSGLVSTRSGNHWVIENNSICWANSAGLDIGSEKHIGEVVDGQPQPEVVGYHLIRNNIISDNGQGGICGIGHFGVQIIGNTLERNNRLGFNNAEESAIKLHCCFDALIAGNLIRDNETGGIWLDADWQRTRITRNVLLNNRGHGIFLELGNGPALVDNNVVALSRSGAQCSGFYSHDAAGFTLAHNLFIENADYGTYVLLATRRDYYDLPPGVTKFAGKWETWTHIDPVTVHDVNISNNIYIDNARGALNIPAVAPAEANIRSDHNLFFAGGVPVLFVPNATVGGHASASDLQPILDRALTEKGIAPDQFPKLVDYQRAPALTLEQWQSITGQDLHSVETRSRGVGVQTRGGAAFRLRRFDNSALSGINCPAIPGIDRDFYGNPLPADNPVPGPFQNLTTATGLLRLSPALDDPTGK